MRFLYTESSPDIGGQELQAIAQMCAMQRSGHQVMLACREHSRISVEAHRYGIPVVHISFRNSLHLPSVLALRQLIVTFRPDIFTIYNAGLHDEVYLRIYWLLNYFIADRFISVIYMSYRGSAWKTENIPR